MEILAPGNPALTVINVFHVAPQHQERLLELLKEATNLSVRYAPGFLGAALHRGLHGTQVTMYAQWRSRAAYEAMRTRQDAAAILAEAVSIARFESGLYEVVEMFAPANA